MVVTPFRFFMLIWATLFGYLFFAHIPRIDTFIGAAIVGASGRYIFFREGRAGQATAIDQVAATAMAIAVPVR